jgi:DNA polymerase elongation subunit (family B)
LKSCDPIDGVIVESYDTEKEVLMAWFRLIKSENPDIITGYNICGFDERYIHGRALLLGLHKEMYDLGKLKEQQYTFGKTPKPFFNKSTGKMETNKKWCEYCGFILEHKLSSSGLGDNKYSYSRMIGRVKIDLMKVIQRDYNLSSYKLDNVLQHFIKDKITNIDGTNIYTQSIDGLYQNNYITLEEDGVRYLNGKKFKIISLIEHKEEYCIKVDTSIDYNNKCKYKWCLVKDDIKPRDIFRLQEGSSADRAKLARYCIQDCATCNLLIAKLNIVTNNISMANVCNVPLSYIFIRGQGIKIFSLVAKKCREKGYLIPVVNKSESDETYEGAVVLVPRYKNGETQFDRNEKEFQGQFYDVPITVLDYASLYPSSMIERNLSHEMLVENPKYDNLEGYIYYDVKYDEKDGSVTHCRYAKKENGDMGILPEILSQLLSERSAVKKLMAKEKDPFRKSIYDGQQLALKVTANSLYGQCGAKTSSISMVKIAASTTAIGRERLEYARDFAENHFKLLTEAIIKNNDKDYNILMDYIIRNIKLTDNEYFDLPYRYDHKKYEELLMKVLSGEYKYSENQVQIITKDIKGKDVKFIRLDKKIKHKHSKKKFNDISIFKFECKVRILYLLSEKYYIEPLTVYGDTDSVFINLGLKNRVDGKDMEKTNVLGLSIELGILLGDIINTNLPSPQNLEYEKTFYPLCLIKKKKYTGNLYEFSPTQFYRKDMGIVLKRRDNADIVKKIVGGIVEIMLNELDLNNVIKFTKKSIEELLSGQYRFEDFIITKTLKGNYKDREAMAHVVLADRIAKRDPGNAPQVNDRIPFIFIDKKKKKGMKQGEFIEIPEYIKEKNLKIDYLYYLERQIMNPSLQFLSLIMDNPEKIFKKAIIMENNKKKGVVSISSQFKVKKKKKDDDETDSDTQYNHSHLIG